MKTPTPEQHPMLDRNDRLAIAVLATAILTLVAAGSYVAHQQTRIAVQAGATAFRVHRQIQWSRQHRQSQRSNVIRHAARNR